MRCFPAASLLEADEVVQVFSQDKKNPKIFRGFSYPTYLDLARETASSRV
jgi:hypothetical protein